MRIIGGKFRGRVLATPPKSRVRPTADPVREALFNILGARVRERMFVDLGAGTGAVGLEAYSRGARPVVLVESDAGAVSTIEKNIAILESASPLDGIEIARSDVRRWIASGALEQLADGVIYLDPPWDSGQSSRWLDDLARVGSALDRALVVVEHRHCAPPALDRWSPRWDRRYGDSALLGLELAR
jgi:16S rRNA (guanine(966)-N(2))-methyltransferase RsmD